METENYRIGFDYQGENDYEMYVQKDTYVDGVWQRSEWVMRVPGITEELKQAMLEKLAAVK